MIIILFFCFYGGQILDTQYVAESSLALAHYVTGYITKAEKSHMQEVWRNMAN